MKHYRVCTSANHVQVIDVNSRGHFVSTVVATEIDHARHDEAEALADALEATARRLRARAAREYLGKRDE